MKETILLFNPPEKEKLLKIEMALFPLHVRLKKVRTEQYCQPLGVLAGIKDMAPAEGTYEGGELPDTLFVFCFMEGNRLDQALAALRMTPTNSQWTAPDCFEEIRREHEAMHS